MNTAKAIASHVTLFTGAKMPVIGFGTFQSKERPTELVKSAILEAGYRHIDAASIYGNEEGVGDALDEVLKGDSGIKREDLFITTKLFQHEKHEVKDALKRSLRKLKLDYVDLYLIHWPQNDVVEVDGKKEFQKLPLHKVWKEMEACVNEGLAKHIGVSNFNLQLLLDLMTYCEIRPAVNQIELHPYHVQYDLVEYLKRMEIVVEAYSPIASPGFDKSGKRLLDEEIIVKLSEKYGKTPAQIILNWGLQRGHVVIPKSSSLERQRENLGAFDFELSPEDVKLKSTLNKNYRIFDPKNWNVATPVFA